MKTIFSFSLFFLIFASSLKAQNEAIDALRAEDDWVIIFQSEDFCVTKVKITISDNLKFNIQNQGVWKNESIEYWCDAFRFENIKMWNTNLFLTTTSSSSDPMKYRTFYGFDSDYGAYCFKPFESDIEGCTIIRLKDYLAYKNR